MKYVLMLLIAIGGYTIASAQQMDRDDYRRNFGQERNEGNDYRHIADINRSYDSRIWEVNNDYSLSEHKKRKMIREINEERAERLKAAKRWDRKEDRRERREGY